MLEAYNLAGPCFSHRNSAGVTSAVGERHFGRRSTAFTGVTTRSKFVGIVAFRDPFFKVVKFCG